MKEQKLSIAQSVIVEEGDPWYGDRIIFQVPCFQFSETVERSSYWSIDSDNETLPGSPKWDDVYYSGENQPDFYTCVWNRDFYMKEIRNTCETISPTDGMTLMETLVMEKRERMYKDRSNLDFKDLLEGKYESVPPSPWWNSRYPNLSLQHDGESCEIANVKLEDAIEEWNRPCCQQFPCPFGRTELSKRQKKIKLGDVFGKSLCGMVGLTHLVNEKRFEMETVPSQEICDWYYDEEAEEEDEEDDNLFDRMELKKSPTGILTFDEKYLRQLANLPACASAF